MTDIKNINIILSVNKNNMCINTVDLELQNYLLKCLNQFQKNNQIKPNITIEFSSDKNNTKIEKYIDILLLNFNNFENIKLDTSFNNSEFIDFSFFSQLKNVEFKSYKNFYYNFKFPNNLKSINFISSEYFDNNIGNLPSELKIIKFGKNFNQPISNLPNKLKKLYFGDSFNQLVNNLPSGLKILSFSSCSVFNQPLDNLPLGLKELYLGQNFLHNLDFLPNTIEIISIDLSSYFNFPIDNLPYGLKKLSLNVDFFQSLDNLPDSVEELVITSKSNIINKFPYALKKLSINIDQLDKINLLDDISIEKLSLQNYYTENTDYKSNLKKFKIPKSLIKLKSNINISSISWLCEYANQNNYVVKKRKYNTRFVMSKIID